MACNYEILMKKLAIENSEANPVHVKQEEYDRTLLDLQVFYLHELGNMPTGRLLDVGCAYGTQTAAFESLGFQVDALDAMPELSSKEWFEKHNIGFYDCNIETGLPPMHNYDVIVFSEVLEHLNYNPVPTMKKLYELLKKGGMILASTPCGEHPHHRQAATGRWATYIHYRDIPEPWNGYKFEDAHHHMYYQQELVQLFHEVGFSVVEAYPIRKGSHHFIKAVKK